MKISLIRSLLIGVSAIFFSQSVMADEFSVETGKRPITLGLGALYRDKVYEDFESKEKTNPIPIVLYEGEHFFVRGGSLGWDFLDSSAMELAVIGEYIGDGYEEDDSDFLDGMDDRDGTFGLGGHFIWKPENLGLKLAAITDVADNSDGTQVRGEVFYKLKTGDWLFKPSAAVIWQDDDYNDYYYGVESNEARTGRAAYTADSDFNYRLGAVAVYQQTGSPWMFLGGIRVDFLGDEISDSTIVEDDNEFAGVLGVAYSFGK